MPPPLLMPVTLVLLGAPPSPAGEPASGEPGVLVPDEGESPTRLEARAVAVTVEASGFGPTEEAALAAARRERDEAIARAISPIHPAQVQSVPWEGPTSWPGGLALEESVVAEGAGFRARIRYSVDDVRPFEGRRLIEGVSLVLRLSPRAGWVVVDAGAPFMEGLLPGDVIVESDDLAVLAHALRDEQPVAVLRAGTVERRVVRHVPQPVQRDRIRLAPTCGPCCHSPGACDRVRGWDP